MPYRALAAREPASAPASEMGLPMMAPLAPVRSGHQPPEKIRSMTAPPTCLTVMLALRPAKGWATTTIKRSLRKA